jgi:hypothetical protein
VLNTDWIFYPEKDGVDDRARIELLDSNETTVSKSVLTANAQNQLNKLFRGGRVCLDNLKHFLSDKLLRFMPLPLSEVVSSSKPHPVSCRQVPGAAASRCKTQNTKQVLAWPQRVCYRTSDTLLHTSHSSTVFLRIHYLPSALCYPC